jgi:hypothetical protein
VVQHPYIKPLIDEAEKALQTGEGSDNLQPYLDKIKEIRDGLLI